MNEPASTTPVFRSMTTRLGSAKVFTAFSSGAVSVSISMFVSTFAPENLTVQLMGCSRLRLITKRSTVPSA